MSSTSPLAPESFPNLPSVDGVRLGTVAAGLRYHGRPDVLVAELAPETTVAGVFTSSLCPSAPVDWCRAVLPGGLARALVCNAGNANAFTGKAGDQSVQATVDAVAAALECPPDEVFVASTGVIGEPIDDAQLVAAVHQAANAVGEPDSARWQEAATAICTTDTYPKGSSAATGSAASRQMIVGIAKGSGMIAPDMATMLSFVFTDAALSAAEAQAVLSAAVNLSFNRVTVDSDTSTSDTVLLFCTGRAGAPTDMAAFQQALNEVCLDLAHQIVKDGEGATKFVTVTVTGAADDTAAEKIARAIADSPLVKTAVAAEDANWGRLVMAVGKAGQAANRDRLAIWIGPEQAAAEGQQVPGYSEERATEHLRQPNVTFTVDVGVGGGTATVWTCDLTHGYIDINAGYRS